MENEQKQKTAKTLTAALIGAIVGCVITGAVLTFSFHRYKQYENEIADYIEASNLIKNNYYEDVDESKFMSNALKGIVSGLDDPYAAYMTPDEYGEAQERSSGTIVGIGVTVTHDDNESGSPFEIVGVESGSPAEEKGVKAGDVITAVNGISTENMDSDTLVNMVKGKEGSTVNVTLERDGKKLELEIERQTIETITSVYTKLKDNIGYIKLSAFKDVTKEQFLNCLKDAAEDDVTGLVIDLRDNGGGTLDSCQTCLDPFLPEGDVASAEFRDGHTETICTSDDKELKMPVSILVNGETASASELFSSAMRDFNKAKLVGTKTFGKGIMQNTIQLSNGGALKLTVARYKTAKSPCFHKIGLEPDYEVELPEGTDISEPDIDKDPQLKKAVEILK